MKKYIMIIQMIALLIILSCDDYLEDLTVQNGLNEGLVAYWPVTESSGNEINDMTGNTNLIVSNATLTAGVYSNAINCTSTTDVSSSKNDYFFQNNHFSISLWIKANNNSAENIFDTNLSAVTIEQQGTGINIYITDPDDLSHQVLTSSNSITTNSWFYLTLTYDGNMVRLYINGNLNKYSVYNLGVTKAADDLNFASGSWIGVLDEIRIYDRALSQKEIQSLMDVGMN